MNAAIRPRDAGALPPPALDPFTAVVASTASGAPFAAHPAHTDASVDHIACHADVLVGCCFLFGFLLVVVVVFVLRGGLLESARGQGQPLPLRLYVHSLPLH